MKLYNFFIYATFSLMLTACTGIKTVHESTPQTSPVIQKQEEVKELFSPLYYSKMDEEYKSIIAQMDKGEAEPQLIQKDFKRWMRNKRAELKQNYKKRKQEFRANQKKLRNEKLNEWHTKRQEVKEDKPSRDELQRFYSKQNAERKEFFALQKEEKTLFKNKVKTEYNDLNQLIKERSRSFKDEFKIYKRTYKKNQLGN